MNLTELKNKFLKNVKISSNCWQWIGSKNKQGYGYFAYLGKYERAHRVSFVLFKKPIPDGLIICHSCDNPSCVNPEHLWAGTHKDNVNDCISKKRFNNSKKIRKLRLEKFIKKHDYFFIEHIQYLLKNGASIKDLGLELKISMRYLKALKDLPITTTSDTLKSNNL